MIGHWQGRSVDGHDSITEYGLDNGLRVLLFPDHSKPRLNRGLVIILSRASAFPGAATAVT